MTEQKPSYILTKGGGQDDLTWKEWIEVFKDGKANYYFFSAAPLLKDKAQGLRMIEELKKRGWECGAMGPIFKEQITYKEVVNSIIFAKAYKQAYWAIVTKRKGRFVRVDLTVEQFLERVDNQEKQITAGLTRRKSELTKLLEVESISTPALIATLLKEGYNIPHS